MRREGQTLYEEARESGYARMKVWEWFLMNPQQTFLDRSTDLGSLPKNLRHYTWTSDPTSFVLFNPSSHPPRHLSVIHVWKGPPFSSRDCYIPHRSDDTRLSSSIARRHKHHSSNQGSNIRFGASVTPPIHCRPSWLAITELTHPA